VPDLAEIMRIPIHLILTVFLASPFASGGQGDDFFRTTSNDTTEQAIVGGVEIQPLSRPYLVALNGNLSCGASLISPHAVMTAAHCLFDDNNWAPPEGVVFNRHNVTDPSGEINVTLTNTSRIGGDVVYHPNYTRTADGFDVAIIFLPREMNEIAPITLNLDPKVPGAQDDPLEVAGWGDVAFGGDSSVVPLSVNLKYVTNRACTNPPYKWQASQIKANMMCAFASGKAACEGDSGGPLVLGRPEGGALEPFVQVGLVSFAGQRCSNDLKPIVFTRVSSVASWVMRTVCDRVGELCPAPTTSPTRAVTTIYMTVRLELEWDISCDYQSSSYLLETAKIIEDAVFTGMYSEISEQVLLFVHAIELCGVQVEGLPLFTRSLSQLLPAVQTTSIEMVLGVSQTCHNCSEQLFNSSYSELTTLVQHGTLNTIIQYLSNGTIDAVITNITNASFTVLTSSPSSSPSTSPSAAPILPQTTTFIEVNTTLPWENYTCVGKTNTTLDNDVSSVAEGTLAGLDQELLARIHNVTAEICELKKQKGDKKRLLQAVNTTFIEMIFVISQVCDNCGEEIFNATILALETIISDGTLNTYIQLLSKGTINAVITNITKASFIVLSPPPATLSPTRRVTPRPKSTKANKSNKSFKGA